MKIIKINLVVFLVFLFSCNVNYFSTHHRVLNKVLSEFLKEENLKIRLIKRDIPSLKEILENKTKGQKNIYIEFDNYNRQVLNLEQARKYGLIKMKKILNILNKSEKFVEFFGGKICKYQLSFSITFLRDPNFEYEENMFAVIPESRIFTILFSDGELSYTCDIDAGVNDHFKEESLAQAMKKANIYIE